MPLESRTTDVSEDGGQWYEHISDAGPKTSIERTEGVGQVRSTLRMGGICG